MIPSFYQLDYKKILKRSRQIKVLNDFELKLIESKEGYLEAKKKQYNFVLEHPGEVRLSEGDQLSKVRLPTGSSDSIKL